MSVSTRVPGVVSLTVLCLAVAGPLGGQHQRRQVLTDDQLYEEAESALSRRDYLEAATSIYAYLQRGTDPTLKNASAQAEFWHAYEGCATQVRRAMNPKDPSVKYAMGVPHLRLPDRAAVANAPSTAGAGDGYPLVCRGGDGLRFMYRQPGGITPEPEVWIEFERGTTAAGVKRENASALAPGHCTWTDRGIAPNEPNTLVLKMSVFAGRQFAIAWQPRGMPSVGSEMREIVGLQREDGVLTLTAYNDGAGHFIVTGIR